MNIYSLSFLFLFLPICVFVYYLVPLKWKRTVLLFASLLFYAMLEPKNLWLLIGSILLDYLVAQEMDACKEHLGRRRAWLFFGVIKNLGIVVVVAVLYQLRMMQSPLGIQIYTLTGMGYLIDLYKGDAKFDRNITNFALMCSFFAKIYTGPLVDYQYFESQINHIKPSLSRIGEGIGRFAQGLAKKVILADQIRLVYEQVQAIPYSQSTVTSIWCLVLFQAFWLYFTLSGMSDVAKGLAEIFSIDLPRNFYYPFQARMVEDFFERFNITVTAFVRKYLYVELGGDQNGPWSTIFNTLLTTMLMGLWFGIRINYMVWGIYFAVFILFERFILGSRIEKIPMFFRRVYSFVVVIYSFTIFTATSLQESWFYITGSIGLNHLEFLDDKMGYILSSNWLLIFCCFFFCTSFVNMMFKQLEKYLPKFHDLFGAAVSAGLLLLVVGFLL